MSGTGFLELWWVFPSSVVFATVAVGAGVSGALFFSPFFMIVVGLSPAQAVGAGLLTESFGMGNGLRSYVRQGLVDYATARWLLAGAVPLAVAGGLMAHRIPAGVLRAVFGAGLVALAGFLLFQRTPEQCEPGEEAGELMDRKSEGKGTTVIEAKDGTVYEYPTCWRLPGVLVGSTLGSRLGAWLPADLMEKVLGGVFAAVGLLVLALQLSG